MKKLITTAAFLVYGTLFMNAQTTNTKNSTTTMPEKPANSTEMKLNMPVQPNGMNRSIDTATQNNNMKMQQNPNRMQQNQALPNNGTLQTPNTTMPNNSATTPQVQPVNPVDPSRPTR